MSESPQPQSLSKAQVSRIVDGLSHNCKFARRKAVDQVREHGLEYLLPSIVNLAMIDKVEEVRIAAIGTIGAIGSPQLIPVVEHILRSSKDEFIDEVATRALQKLRQREQN